MLEANQSRITPSIRDLDDLLAVVRTTGTSGKPAVVVVDDIDYISVEGDAELWWSKFDELSYQLSGYPAIVVATYSDSICSGPHVVRSRGDEAAQRITARGHAQCERIGRLTDHDLFQLTGEADKAVLSLLIRLGSRDARTTVDVWQELRSKETVALDQDGAWRIKELATDSLGRIGDQLTGDLRHALHNQLDLVPKVRHWLGVAAMEGQTFTAQPLSDAVRIDRDQLIDILDLLTESAVHHQDVPRTREPLLVDASPIVVGDHLWRYRFSDPLTFRYLQELGVAERERDSVAVSLAQALVESYAYRAHEISTTIVKLLLAAGAKEVAESWSRIEWAQRSTETRLLLVCDLYCRDTSDWKTADYLWGIEQLLRVTELENYVSYDLLAEIQGTAEEWSRRIENSQFLAKVLCCRGTSLNNMGRVDEGIHALSEACSIAQTLDDEQLSIEVKLAYARACSISPGHADRALVLETAAEAISLARRTGTASPERLAVLGQIVDDPAERLDYIREAISAAGPRPEQPSASSFHHWLLASELTSTNSIDEAVQVALRGAEIAREGSVSLSVALNLILAAGYLMRMDRYEEARSLLPEIYLRSVQVDDSGVWHRLLPVASSIAIYIKRVDLGLIAMTIDLLAKPGATPERAQKYLIELGGDQNLSEAILNRAIMLRAKDGERGLITDIVEAAARFEPSATT